MLQINVKTAKENKDNPMVALKLNSASVPRVGEKITIDGMQYVIRSIRLQHRCGADIGPIILFPIL